MEENSRGVFGRTVEWRETYRPVMAGPVDGRAIYFALPFIIFPRWPMTPLALLVIGFIFWILMQRKIDPTNVLRMMVSYSIGTYRSAVSRFEYRKPKDYGFETPEMVARETEIMEKRLKEAYAKNPELQSEEPFKPRKIKLYNCRMG